MKQEDYWFPKKRCGWGWGPPNNWRGWIFLLAWLALLMLGQPSLQGLAGVVFFVGMLAVLAIVLYFRGEPPGRGNWGRRG